MVTKKYRRMVKAMVAKETGRRIKKSTRVWSVYILRCADNTFYTGITNNIDRRILMHNKGTGAKYTRKRGPVVLIYQENKLTRPKALSREYAIKRLSRTKKEQLIKCVSI